ATLRRRVVGGGAEAAAEVGHAHAREHVSAHVVRRKRAGAAENAGGDSRRRQQLPYRRPPAEVDGLGWEVSVLLLVPVQRVVGQIRLRVAPDEIEDAVAPRGDRKSTRLKSSAT